MSRSWYVVGVTLDLQLERLRFPFRVGHKVADVLGVSLGTLRFLP